MPPQSEFGRADAHMGGSINRNPRIVVMDPSHTDPHTVSTLVRSRRWHAVEVQLGDLAEADLAGASVVIAFEDDLGQGTAALRAAKAHAESTARILVCDTATAARAIARGEPTHQVVVRPAGQEKVRAAIQRALRVQDLLDDPMVRQSVSALGTLPPRPGTWFALCEVLRSDSATLGDAADLVQQDVGLAAKVLRLANSGMLGGDRHLGSLFTALQRLGLKVVRDLVLAVEVFDAAGAADETHALAPIPLFLTSQAVACTAREVAPRAATDIAFTAGLLFQLGRLIFASKDRARFAQVLDRVADGQDAHHAEAVVFGVDSRSFAAWLLASWGLPHEVVEAVRWCDTPSKASGRGSPLALSVYLASRLVEEAAWQRVCGESRVLVTRAELAPWGLSASLDRWRQDSRDILARICDAATPTS